MKIPPSEYFIQCSAGDPGAQRIGANWYRFRDEHQLALFLGDYVGQLQQDSETLDHILEGDTTP